MESKVKFYRERAGLYQRELADLVGVSDSSIKFWEKGLKLGVLVSALKISRALDQPLEKVFCGHHQGQFCPGAENRINFYRGSLGLTLVDLGRLTGLGKSVLSLYDRGTRLTGLHKYFRLSRALDQPLGKLFVLPPGAWPSSSSRNL